jgi:hypothetical protein
MPALMDNGRTTRQELLELPYRNHLLASVPEDESRLHEAIVARALLSLKSPAPLVEEPEAERRGSASEQILHVNGPAAVSGAT